MHQAADGALARVRLPGGMIAPAQLEALAHAASEWGSPAMELTSRASIQIRALSDTAKLAEVVAGVGLLPSETHELVRNIVASPLSGRTGGKADIRGIVTELDSAIQHEAELARLPGRFLFGIDDGRGDISGPACGRRRARRLASRPRCCSPAVTRASGSRCPERCLLLSG